jgi:hypothetical protein
VDHSLAELLSLARGNSGDDGSPDIAEAAHCTVSALLALALQALNGFDAEAPASNRISTPSGRFTAMHAPKSGPKTLHGELEEELRLVEQETGIAPDPTAPIAGYVRAVALTGNARAQRLLARLKAALSPPVL